jgi:hypothetical protein
MNEFLSDGKFISATIKRQKNAYSNLIPYSFGKTGPQTVSTDDFTIKNQSRCPPRGNQTFMQRQSSHSSLFSLFCLPLGYRTIRMLVLPTLVIFSS